MTGLLKLSCPQWNAFSAAPFIAGFLANGGRVKSLEFGVCVLLGLSFSAVTDLTNRLADRVEDAIDYPTRAQLLRVVGEDRLRVAIMILVGVYLVSFLVLATVVKPPITALCLWLLALGGALAYSVGVRTKTRK